MYQAWAAAGLPPGDFWGMTLGLFSIHMRAASDAAERRAEEIRAQAYVTAALIRAQKLPEYSQFVAVRTDKASRRQRWLEAWNKVDRALAQNKAA